MIELSATLGLAGLARPAITSPTFTLDEGAFGALMSSSFAVDEPTAAPRLTEPMLEDEQPQQTDRVDLVELGVLTGLISVVSPPPTVPVAMTSGSAPAPVPTRHPAKPSIELATGPHAGTLPPRAGAFEAAPAPAVPNPILKIAVATSPEQVGTFQELVSAPAANVAPAANGSAVVMPVPMLDPGALSPAAVLNVTVSLPVAAPSITRTTRPDTLPSLAATALVDRPLEPQLRASIKTSRPERTSPVAETQKLEAPAAELFVVDTVDTQKDAFFGVSATSVTPTSPIDGTVPNSTTTALQSAAAVVERHLDLARDDIWLAELAKDIVSLADRDDQLSFRLTPRHLGQLDVSLTQSDAGVSIEMTAAQDEARAILTTAQPRLIEDIRAQGVRVAEAHVGSGSGGHNTSQNGSQSTPRAPQPLSDVATATSEAPSSPTQARPEGRFA